MNQNIENAKEELINKIIELDKEKKRCLIGSGYILKQDNNSNYKVIDINNLIGHSEIDDIFASKIKLSSKSIEDEIEFYYIIDIFYNLYNDNYEMKLYKHTKRIYYYKTTWKNKITEENSVEIHIENIEDYKLKIFNREENIINFVFINKNEETTIMVIKIQVSDL